MKIYKSILKYKLLIILSIISVSCTSQEKKKAPISDQAKNNSDNSINNASQIGQYLVSIFEDSKGNMWFGTLEKGIAKFDGESLRYFTMEDGLIGNAVVSVTEDEDGILWFGTHSGLSKYEGTSFTNYTEEDGLCHHRVSNLLIDSKGNFWIGTWGGVCLFNGKEFTDFPIPNPDIETPFNEYTKDWITEIMEDSKGNIWFSRDGYGACKYDGNTFKHFTKNKGLLSNNLQSIEEANDGSIWFGTRVAEKDHEDEYRRHGKGGLSSYKNGKFTHYPNIVGLSKNDVYGIFNDSSGNMWVSTTSNGVYKFDGKKFTNYPLRIGMSPKAVMNILEDSKGNIWIGCAGGLFRLNKNDFVNITVNGPWE